MSYFEGQGEPWPRHQPSWEQPHSFSYSIRSPLAPPEEPSAFSSQFEEIARATDNLAKSGKTLGGIHHARRDSLSSAFARQYPDFEPRVGGPPRHPSISDYEGIRSHSSHSSTSLQGYLANQRFGPRPSEAEQMMQAKRRAAAQRERELRNYYQEQQYQRTSGAKSDRSTSPSAQSEEERRELIARQHRALYGNESSMFPTPDHSNTPRPISQDARVLAAAASSGLAPSPRVFESFGMPPGSAGDAGVTIPQPGGQVRSRSNSTSPTANQQSTFAMFESNQQADGTSNSSPGETPAAKGQFSKGNSGNVGVAPIGTRPAPSAAAQGKRTTPPTSSPLGLTLQNERNNVNSLERTTSSASNPPNIGQEKAAGLGWGTNSGPWGSTKNPLGVQASVWG